MSQSTISDVSVSTYERTVRHIAQQSVVRLLPWVAVRGEESKDHNWEKMGKADTVTKTRRMPTAESETGFGVVAPGDEGTPWLRRQSVPITKAVSDTVDRMDEVKMLVDPNSNYAKAHGMAMRRAQDSEIIRAASSDDALDGTGTPETIAAAQQIGGDGIPFSFDLVTETSELFMANDIDPDEEKVFVIGPKQARKMLQLTEATSGDYNALKPLTSKGYIESWMGYSWIVSTLLDLDGGTNVRRCFAMTRQALGFNINDDIWAQIAQDPSLSFAWRIYCESTFGAVRVEDEHIVHVDVEDTV